MNTSFIDKVPDQIGFLVLNEDGAVLASGGDLENDEASANVIFNMVRVADKSLLSLTDQESGFKRLSVHYDDVFYVVAVSNKKILVVKRKYVPTDPAIA